MFLLRLSFSYASWFFSLRNLSLSKVGGTRRSGGPISSSHPRHDAKDQKDRHKRDRERRKEKPRADYRWAQKKNIEITILYGAWTLLTDDACSNAVRSNSILLQNHKIGLSIEFTSKTPKFEKPIFTKPNKLINWSLHKIGNTL